jgi:hypothetical protein
VLNFDGKARIRERGMTSDYIFGSNEIYVNQTDYIRGISAP